ncbi:alternate-type signal peptide domain-containing protein [Salinibacterium sp. NK8237]|uniref:alternate-type signal peptide domain-containing protein n=1 Tax=Salinibacterium sp. NK8237 TaxID=2792038 RepID=UPI0018CDFF22|nr:alternate-type signal peptide domain-containing protein [Salinibacterium sp. NK8237]MBH0129955.1 alternate-type signal peptide domain-containing protein [Salinibacterium sp. NK8237]
MNKLVKGSIAGAAGIALLLGGAGTLATWNSIATVSAGTNQSINAGTLDIVAAPGTITGDGWKLGTKATVTSPTFKIVPGDTFTYTKTFNVTATGDNLSAAIAVAPASVAAVSTSVDADVKLAAAIVATATFTVNGSPATSISPTTGTQPVVVTVTMNYPKSTTAGAENLSKLGAVSLSNFAITLTQN